MGVVDEAGVHDVLLMDVGFVIMGISWAAVEAFEAATGTRIPRSDDRQEESTEADWGALAVAAGFDGLRGLFAAVAQTVPETMFDPAALALMEDARLAGLPVGILSNDAYTFLGRDYIEGRPEFSRVDVFVDATDIGVRKPDPAAYLAAASALSVSPERVVFLDDTPACAEGARAVGMVGIDVDPLDRLPAFDRARELLGLGPWT